MGTGGKKGNAFNQGGHARLVPGDMQQPAAAFTGLRLGEFGKGQRVQPFGYAGKFISRLSR